MSTEWFSNSADALDGGSGGSKHGGPVFETLAELPPKLTGRIQAKRAGLRDGAEERDAVHGQSALAVAQDGLLPAHAPRWCPPLLPSRAHCRHTRTSRRRRARASNVARTCPTRADDDLRTYPPLFKGEDAASRRQRVLGHRRAVQELEQSFQVQS